MDGAELDLDNVQQPASVPAKTISVSEDYETDLKLAAEFGRFLLEQNQELRNYINSLQKQTEEIQSEMKILQAKFVSTREQLDEKSRQSEILDAANYDLEQELSAQRRDNEKNRQQIKELFRLCETTRRQCQEIEQEYDRFRSKQIESFFPTNCSIGRQRAHSLSVKSLKVSEFPPSPTTIFDLSSAQVYKSHLKELKSRIQQLNNDCAFLTEQLERSEEEKQFLIDRLNQIERQRRDENYSFENELSHYKKLLEKYRDTSISTKIKEFYPSPEHEISLYEEVQTEKNQKKSFYEPTDYRSLFQPLYEKLKIVRS